jgi:hypothetical protein
VNDRDRSFRNLCRCIYTDFLMKHALDPAGRPTKLWEHLQQEAATSDSTGDGADRCRFIYTDLLIKHALDPAGQPTKLREHRQQEAATNGSTGDGADRRVGRPRLTEEEWQERAEKVEKVLQKAKDNNISEKTASELLGLPYSTFKGWKRRTKK